MKMMVALIAMLVLLPASALAGECSTDSECPDGFECVPMPCSCACEDCPDGEECPPCECPECEDSGECIEKEGELECEVDEDCPEGYECWMTGTQTCACEPCPEGEECPPCECPEEEEGQGYCFEVEDWFDDIIAGECETDDDCPVQFICEEIDLPCDAYPTCPPCACPGCDPDDEDCTEEPDCDCPPCEEPEPCEEETAKMCVFDPIDCEADADCEDGFECVELEECWGSGGGCMCTDCVCADCPDGEECEPCDCPEEPECECDDEEWEEECVVYAAICLPAEVPCEGDDECAEGFVCVADEGGGGCACPGCDCPPCPEGEECEPCDCPPCECEEGEDESYCIPEGWEEADFYGGGQAMGEDYDKNDPENPDPDDKGATEENEEPTGEGGDGAAAQTEDEPETGDYEPWDGKGNPDCSTGTGGNQASLLLLAFALLALAVVRRIRFQS